MMTNPKKSGQNKSNVMVNNDGIDSTKPANGDIRAAIIEIIENDDTVIQSIIDTVSDVIVKKLLSNCSFVDKLADKLLSNGVLDNVKQSVYEANEMDKKQTYATVTAIENRLSDLRTDNLALADEVDDLEQYSRRNCPLLHGMPECDEDSNEAVISVCNGKLELNISADDIDGSHRLGSSRN